MTPAANTPTMLTIAQTAQQLGVHPRTVHRFMASGELPFVRLTPRAVRIRNTDVEALIQARTINNAA